MLGQWRHASVRDGICRPYPEQLTRLDGVVAAWPLDRYARAKRRDTEELYLVLKEYAPERDLCITFSARPKR